MSDTATEPSPLRSSAHELEDVPSDTQVPDASSQTVPVPQQSPAEQSTGPTGWHDVHEAKQ